jgi:hypothetical protein
MASTVTLFKTSKNCEIRAITWLVRAVL